MNDKTIDLEIKRLRREVRELKQRLGRACYIPHPRPKKLCQHGIPFWECKPCVAVYRREKNHKTGTHLPLAEHRARQARLKMSPDETKRRQSQYDRAYRHRPEIRARDKEVKSRWQFVHAEEIAARKRAWFAANKAQCAARKRRYRARQKLLAKHESV